MSTFTGARPIADTPPTSAAPRHPAPPRPSRLVAALPIVRRTLLAAAPALLVLYSVSYEHAIPSAGLGAFPWWVSMVTYLAAGASLYASKRSPLLAATAAALCWLTTGSALFVIAVSLLLGYRQPRRWIFYLIGLAILHPIEIVPDPLSFVTGQVLLPSWSVPLYSCFFSALAGVALRAARDETHGRERELQRSVAEAETRAELAVAEDRLRMSREMHDILGHQLSTMVLLSTALVAQPDSTRAKPIAVRIADTGHRAIDDLQHVLRLLDAPSGSATTRPAARQRLRDSIESARQFGHVVQVADGEPPRTGTDAGLLIDAITEAVHNAVKHAPGSPIDIDWRTTGSSVHLVVSNGAALRPPHEQPLGTGSGLRLLAARAAAAGGSCTASPSPCGGYRLDLEVPR